MVSAKQRLLRDYILALSFGSIVGKRSTARQTGRAAGWGGSLVLSGDDVPSTDGREMSTVTAEETVF